MNLVYALCDPRGDAVRYVGKTVRGYQRQSEHWRLRAGDTSLRAEWIRSLLRDGVKPQFRILGMCASREGLAVAEREWIAFYLYRQSGADLTNMSTGGEGVVGFKQSAEAIKKSADKRRGRTMPPEVRERNRLAHLGQVVTEEHRRKLSLAGKGKPKSADWRAKMSATRLQMPDAIRRRKHTPETRAKMRASHLARNRKDRS